jgi:hypothetical protein
MLEEIKQITVNPLNMPFEPQGFGISAKDSNFLILRERL